MCRTARKKTNKLVTRQQRMGEQLRVFSWPDGKVLIETILLSAEHLRQARVDQV
jgi:hypothetical protein